MTREAEPGDSSGDSSVFDRAIHDAIELLRTLPRAPDDLPIARAQLEEFVTEHAPAADFLVDLGPGAPRADFDLYVEHPAGGTVALSYRDDGGRPWFVDYAQHWAANTVLHVGSLRVTIQEALFALQQLHDERSDLTGALVRDALVADRLAVTARAHPDRIAVSAEELQTAADDFRRARGLHSAVATHAWLERMGWSPYRFRYMLQLGLELRKMEALLVADQLDDHLADHAADYDLVEYLRITCGTAALAAALADEAREQANDRASLLSAVHRVLRDPARAPGAVRCTIEETRAHRLGPIASAPVASVHGPVEERDARGVRYVVTQLVRRTPAEAGDAATRALARERLLEEWTAARLRETPVRWNWS